MLFLLFKIGQDSYALDAGQIAAVLPLTNCKKIPATPLWIEGLLDYGTQHIPVLDISMLATGTPCIRRLSTRLVLVHYQPVNKHPQLLGLLLEHATDTLRCHAEDFAESGIAHEEARYLGPVMRHENRLVQRIHVADLLDPATQALLFQEAGPA